MHFYSIVLVAFPALLAKVSSALQVETAPTTTFKPSAVVLAKRLLRGTEPSNDEDRMQSVVSKLKSVASSAKLMLQQDRQILKQYMPDNVHLYPREQAAWAFINNCDLENLVDAFESKKSSLFLALRDYFGDQSVAHAIVEAKLGGDNFKKIAELSKDQLKYWKRRQISYDDVFEILQLDVQRDSTGRDFVVKLTLLDEYISSINGGQHNDDILFDTVIDGYKDRNLWFQTMYPIAMRDTPPELIEFQERLIDYLSREKEQAYEYFFTTGGMHQQGVGIFLSPMLRVLGKLYSQSNEGKSMLPNQDSTVEALRKVFGDDKKLALFFLDGLTHSSVKVRIGAANVLDPFLETLKMSGITSSNIKSSYFSERSADEAKVFIDSLRDYESRHM